MYFDALYALFILYTTEEQCKGAYIRLAMKKPLSPVILSAAKDLRPLLARHDKREILRGAQDDIWRQVGNGTLL
jgi:hypothetical protein